MIGEIGAHSHLSSRRNSTFCRKPISLVSRLSKSLSSPFDTLRATEWVVTTSMVYPFVVSQPMHVSRFPATWEIEREGGEYDRLHSKITAREKLA